jgi:tetratricopeptide (TPR) repeat protein
MSETRTELCSDQQLQDLVEGLRIDEQTGLAKLERLELDHPLDARLPFLRGSVLAGLGRYPEAHDAMMCAVSTAPDYSLARFQLGLLELTSGDASAAITTWAPLDILPLTDPLRRFAIGLRHLIADDFDTAIACLRSGIASNSEHPLLNIDMQRVIESIANRAQPATFVEEPVSSTQTLLRQSLLRPTRH